MARAGACAALCLLIANCASSDKFARKVDPKYGVMSSPRVVEGDDPVPRGGGTYRVGKPYVVAGRTYVPEENPDYAAEGMASWYGADFHGRRTANGEVFDMHTITAAHPTLPIPSYARVTNLSNRRSIIVRINDRGPYHDNRLIDVSVKTSHLLGFHANGVARVRVEYVGRAPLEGDDENMLVATLREGEAAPAPTAVMVASARPFIPAFISNQIAALQPKRLLGGSGGGSLAPSDVPLPSDRPFTLNDQRSALESRSSLNVASAAGRDRNVAAAPLPAVIRQAAARPPSSAAAYGSDAGLAGQGAAPAMTGRGLY